MKLRAGVLALRRTAALGLAALITAGVTWALMAHPTSLPISDDPGQNKTLDVDATLRTAAKLAAVPGLKDGSLDWLPKKHLLRSRRGSVASGSIDSVRFDFATSTFCISASNGHRITNASRGVELGTCGPLPPAEGGMSSVELALARDVAEGEILQARATVTSATVTADNKGVFGSTTALACTSRRILHITLIGSFPGVVISPAIGDPDPTPRALRIAVDGKSGHICDIGVVTRKVRPAHGAVAIRFGHSPVRLSTD